MHSHRSFLILGSDAGEMISLIKGGYEISRYRFAFEQGVDRKGRATTRVYAGSIDLIINRLLPPPIIQWGIQSRKRTDGAIIMLDYENVPIQKILFKNAICAEMEFDYVLEGASYSQTRLSIQAEQLVVGDGLEFTNEWIED